MLHHPLRAFAGHGRAPAVEPGALEQIVQQGQQAHASPGRLYLGHVVGRGGIGRAVSTTAHPRKIHPQFDLARHRFQHRLPQQAAQARQRRLGGIRRAAGMMAMPGVGHALDLEVPVVGHVHLHAPPGTHRQRGRSTVPCSCASQVCRCGSSAPTIWSPMA